MKSLLLFGFILIGAQSAQAAPICPLFAATKQKILRCEDNFILGNIADSCLSNLTKQLSAGKVDVAAFAADSAQLTSQKESKATLENAIKKLDAQILFTEAALAAVKSYSEKTFLPEDYDKPSLIGMSTQKYLSTERCYSVPKQVMDENEELIALMLSDLKNTRALVSNKRATSIERADQLETTGDATQPAAAPAPVGTKGEKKIMPTQRKSDITGTKEEKEKSGNDRK